MQDVTITKTDGNQIVIPISNLDNTLRVLGDKVKKVDYGVEKVEPKAKKTRKTKKKK